jgi:hypothetical protein
VVEPGSSSVLTARRQGRTPVICSQIAKRTVISVFVCGHQMAAGPEVGRDAGEHGQKPLCSAHGAEAFHRPFALPGRLVAVLRPVVDAL